MKAITKNNYLSHFIGIIFVLMSASDVLSLKGLIFFGAAMSIVVFALCFPIKDKNLFSESIIFILFMFIATLVNLFFTKNNFGGSLTLLGSLFLSFIYFHANSKKLTLWIIASYLITLLFISYKLFILKIPANYIYLGLSRNHAGFSLIFWTIFLLFHLKVTYNRFPIILPLISLILSYFLFGRTSIIVSALLLLVVFFYKFNNTRLKIIAVTAFLICCYYLWLNFGFIVTEETNLGEGLDTPRWKLWRVYMENIDVVNLFTGIDVTKIQFYNLYGNNPHNSFIKFHSRVGLGSLVFIFLLFVSIFNYLKERQYYIFWLLILLIMRAFFDSDILIGSFDFIFFIVTFYWIKTD